MNKEEQIESYEEVQEYLQKNNIYGLFSQLVQDVILQKPANVLDFLIHHLEAPEKFTLFVIGPPGLAINSIIKKALTNSQRNFQIFNFGEQITKNVKLLNEPEKEKFQSCKLVHEEFLGNMIKSVETHTKSEKNYIIEGFPKNIKQALILQKRGVYAKNILIINVDDQGLKELCQGKINSFNPNASAEVKARLVQAAINEHRIYLNEIKIFYKKYMEIDLSRNRDEEHIIKELNKAFTIKTLQPVPRISSQIIIVGAPYSGRTTLGNKIATHYNLVYISVSHLIAEQIRKETIHGRKIKSQFINNELVDNFLIEKLIEQRIAKKDCRMQGFVLEGYPKNKEQYENIKNMKLHPTMIVAIDTPLELSVKRANNGKSIQDRYEHWKNLVAHLKEVKHQIFWADPNLNVDNLYEEVIYEFQKQFI